MCACKLMGCPIRAFTLALTLPPHLHCTDTIPTHLPTHSLRRGLFRYNYMGIDNCTKAGTPLLDIKSAHFTACQKPWECFWEVRWPSSLVGWVRGWLVVGCLVGWLVGWLLTWVCVLVGVCVGG